MKIKITIPDKQDMNLAQARKTLNKLGFEFNERSVNGNYRFGKKTPESISLYPDHFQPKFRGVWIRKEARGNCRDRINGINFLVSGHIRGVFRKYKSKNCYEKDVGYVSGLGRTLKEAIDAYVARYLETYPINTSCPANNKRKEII